MKVSLLGIGLLALTSTLGFAQAASQKAPAPEQRHAATINQRRAFQQHRIAQGVRTGRLSRLQARKLERREVSIGRQVHHMRRANGGRLNHMQRARINHRLNRTGRAINRSERGTRKQ
jgi:hypothetical protein